MGTPTRWIISSGQEVTVGDEVALEFHPDEIGIITGVHPERGLPAVRVTEGPNRGRTRPLVFPSEILMKRGGGDASMKDYYGRAQSPIPRAAPRGSDRTPTTGGLP